MNKLEKNIHQTTPLPVAICAEKHRDFGVTSPPSGRTRFGAFSPITLAEFPIISKYYPIVFMDGPTLTPIAITQAYVGEAADPIKKNSGHKLPYIPAVHQLYPFMLQKMPDEDSGMLLFDESSNQLVRMSSNAKAEALFMPDGQPTELLRNVGTFAAELYLGRQHATKFAYALREAGLLIPSPLEIESLSTSTGKNFQRLYSIDEPRLRALPDVLIVDWFRQGYLDAATLTVLSQRHWVAT